MGWIKCMTQQNKKPSLKLHCHNIFLRWVHEQNTSQEVQCKSRRSMKVIDGEANAAERFRTGYIAWSCEPEQLWALCWAQDGKVHRNKHILGLSRVHTAEVLLQTSYFKKKNDVTLFTLQKCRLAYPPDGECRYSDRAGRARLEVNWMPNMCVQVGGNCGETRNERNNSFSVWHDDYEFL